ncbi:unnamed protein product [Cylindrotheca closterium]|uniref:RWD domain-containing protein n=1 Tax=Cylindrotheca closterium TaxID=2856 RepID=A0AAD2CFA2_9STRA|nr:unnamed protein product [Cylindrotheca closterium]
MTLSEEELEALERSVNEIDALSAIYGESSESGETDQDELDSCFSILSKQEMDVARSILRGEKAEVPTLEVEISTGVQMDDGTSEKIILKCCIPPGYPDHPVIPTASSKGMSWSIRDELSSQLAEIAESMVGSESIMGLVAELNEMCPPVLQRMQLNNESSSKSQETTTTSHGDGSYSRLWIWVHHITNNDRRKSIMAEAQGLKLGGVLKHGYPGIILIEGRSNACDDFATWVKGSKSLPGGFGRNLGHHVRGQVQLEAEEEQQLCFASDFQEMEDMAVLGQLCKEKGLEDEFREFAMRHKG